MRLSALGILFAAAIAISGCSFQSIANSVNPYRIDIRQGNYVDQAMVSQLRQGMTREQVRFVLGTPLIADMFHDDRWDYVYLFEPGRGSGAEKRRISLFFEDDRLQYIDGDVVADSDEEAVVGAPRAGAQERSRVIEVPAKGD